LDLRANIPKVSVAILIFIIFLSFFGGYIYSPSPYILDKDSLLLTPSYEHLFGTDRLGRDVLARVIEGGKISLIIGFLSATIASLIGLFVGVIAGYMKGFVDKWFVLVIDLFLTFPTFFLLLALVSYIDASSYILIIVISITGWMGMARLIRSESYKVAKQPYIKILKIAKVSSFKIIFKYFAPILAPIFLVSFTFGVSGAILAESGLSFLGLGVTPPQMSWGSLISEGKDVLTIAWWVSFFPGLMIFLVTFSLINISDYLQSIFNQKSIQKS
jgi:peptide/nickel transport system permease protein